MKSYTKLVFNGGNENRLAYTQSGLLFRSHYIYEDPIAKLRLNFTNVGGFSELFFDSYKTFIYTSNLYINC